VAVEALTLHPLVNSYSLAKELIKQYLELNKDYTKDWK
jgi:6-phospho-beta-glucosidase